MQLPPFIFFHLILLPIPQQLSFSPLPSSHHSRMPSVDDDEALRVYDIYLLRKQRLLCDWLYQVWLWNELIYDLQLFWDYLTVSQDEVLVEKMDQKQVETWQVSSFKMMLMVEIKFGDMLHETQLQVT